MWQESRPKNTDHVCARSMVMKYGMDDDLGHVNYDEGSQGFLGGGNPFSSKKYGEKTADLIDHSTKTLVETALENALDILKRNKEILEISAQKLLDKETLNADELGQLIKECHV